MVTKNFKKNNLEGKRTIFFETGMIIALALVLLGFQHKNYQPVNYKWINRGVPERFEDDYFIPTPLEERSEIPKPKPVTTLIDIVADDRDVIDEPVFDVGDNQNKPVEGYVPPVDLKPNEEKNVDEPDFVLIPDIYPSFPGGDEAMARWMHDHITYPEMARINNIQGPVYVKFVVEADGCISYVEIERGIGGGCDEEAARVIQAMPCWNPGKQRGKPVRVQLTMPIRFTLKDY